MGDSCTGISSFVFVVVLQLASVGHRLVLCARVCMGARGAGKQVGRQAGTLAGWPPDGLGGWLAAAGLAARSPTRAPALLSPAGVLFHTFSLYEQCRLPMIGVLGPGILASSAELRPSSGRAAIHGFASKIHEESLAPHEKSIKSIDFIDFS